MAECLDTTTGALIDVLPIDCPDGLIQWGPYRLDTARPCRPPPNCGRPESAPSTAS